MRINSRVNHEVTWRRTWTSYCEHLCSKTTHFNLTENHDLIINVGDVNSACTIQRTIWPAFKGTPDSPFNVHEIPTIYVSVQNPFDFADVPQVSTYINNYDGMLVTMEELVKKLADKSEFKGVGSVDLFCG